MYVIDTTCFDECLLFHVIAGANLASPIGLVEPPCCCVLEIRTSILKGNPQFMSVISTITLQCCQYQRPPKKSYFLNFLKKFYLLIAFLLHSFICECSTFFFINRICKSQKLPGDIFLRKSIRAIRLSDKYDLRFQDRSFDVE